MQEYIENTKTFISTESLKILKEAGKAIGDFQNELDGFNAESLYEIIPKFHYTPNRVSQLRDALELRNKLCGGKWDWIDFGCTMAGVIVGRLVRVTLLGR